MSKFGQDPAGRTTNLPFPAPGNKWSSEFEAFGKLVPTHRQVSALDSAVEVIGVEAVLADTVITLAAKYIERDEPAMALMTLMNIVDLTGAYRLLAVMCTDD